MCFLCMRDNPFDAIESVISPEEKGIVRVKSRTKAFKVMMQLIDEELKTQETCYIGDATVSALRQEQQRLMRML